jgi:DNA-directed RNA polymerase specialized sigma24 family protein
MVSQKQLERLSRIQTRWTLVLQAHRGEGEAVTYAQQQLLLRYYRPIYRYLRALVRAGDTAEELTHEFAVRFLRGDFKRADPSRGRFRDLLKQAVRNLAIDYWRRRQLERNRTPFPPPRKWPKVPRDGDWRRAPPEPKRAAGPNLDPAEDDRVFLRGWREEVLAQAWQALARFEDQSGCSYLTVLHLRATCPQLRCTELADLASTQLGKPLSETAFRQLLHRAREKFADLLVAEVARSLATSDPDAVEAELVELRLLAYCRQATTRLRKSSFLE